MEMVGELSRFRRQMEAVDLHLFPGSPSVRLLLPCSESRLHREKDIRQVKATYHTWQLWQPQLLGLHLQEKEKHRWAHG